MRGSEDERLRSLEKDFRQDLQDGQDSFSGFRKKPEKSHHPPGEKLPEHDRFLVVHSKAIEYQK